MKATDVLDALATLFPESEWVHVREAPMDAARQGRKLDLLVISMWASRSHERVGVEVKVSISDWRRELAQAAKADGWFRRTDRFFVAVPLAIAAQVESEAPPAWGVIACTADPPAAKVIRKAQRRTDTQPLGDATWIGLLRAAHDAGPGALARARAAGEQHGYRQGKADGERATANGQQQAALEGLQARVAAFEQATGRPFDHWSAVPKLAPALVVAEQLLVGRLDGGVLERAATVLDQSAAKVRDALAQWRAIGAEQ